MRELFRNIRIQIIQSFDTKISIQGPKIYSLKT